MDEANTTDGPLTRRLKVVALGMHRGHLEQRNKQNMNGMRKKGNAKIDLHHAVRKCRFPQANIL
jgi:hypothetical protein